ncbi:hypothetical protein Gorai_006180, partial [Gossypium raimondii]|nr:hypothetical protein [Gossypium raimondii]
MEDAFWVWVLRAKYGWKDQIPDSIARMTKDSGNASAEGVVRDLFGKWILGFNRYLGKCSPFEATLW